MDFETPYEFEIFNAEVWIKVKVKVLSDALALYKVYDKNNLKSIWNFNPHDQQGKIHKIQSGIRYITIHKKKLCGLGVSIKGGQETQTPIIISKIFKGMAVDLSGTLSVGDAIFSVNGQDLRNASHEEAVKLLKKAGQNVTMEVEHLKPNLFINGMFHLCTTIKKDNIQLSKPSSLPNVTLKSEFLNHDLEERIFGEIPLNLAHIETTLESTDCAKKESSSGAYKFITMYSPDLVQSYQLRTTNKLHADALFALISKQIESLNRLHTARLKQILPKLQIKKVGWVLEQTCLEIKESSLTSSTPTTYSPEFVKKNGAIGLNTKTIWRPMFLVITNKSLLLYETAPLRVEDWNFPVIDNDLISTRVVGGLPLKENFHLRSDENNYIESDAMFSFTVRTGKASNVDSHVFSVSSAYAQQCWIEAIVNGTQTSLISQPYLPIPCEWKGVNAYLLLHCVYGITLVPMKNDICNKVEIGKKFQSSTAAWSFPFELLCSTADDGDSILLFGFGKHGEQILKLPGGVKPVVFILLNMLSVKLLRRKLVS